MSDEQFKKMDEHMMKRMKPVRDRRVAPEFLKGFAASVVRKIESKNGPAPVRSLGWRHACRQAGAAVPVFAVLVLAVVTVMRLPGQQRPVPTSAAPAVFEIAQLPDQHPVEAAETALTEEIEALKELGAWTDEDEKAAGVTGEEEEIAEVLG